MDDVKIGTEERDVRCGSETNQAKCFWKARPCIRIVDNRISESYNAYEVEACF